MKNIKVFYLNEEVASFSNIIEAINYIKDMLKVDKKLHKNQFTIYSKISF